MMKLILIVVLVLSLVSLCLSLSPNNGNPISTSSRGSKRKSNKGSTNNRRRINSSIARSNSNSDSSSSSSSSSKRKSNTNKYNDDNIKTKDKTKSNINTITTSTTNTNNRNILILVDPFTEYISGKAKQYCNDRGIRVIEIVSPYLLAYLRAQGRELPTSMMTPNNGNEYNWAISKDIILHKDNTTTTRNTDATTDNTTDATTTNDEIICILSESDAGVPCAEKIQHELKGYCNVIGNGITPSLRNKFLMNDNAKKYGLTVVEQVLAKTWEECQQFIENLWSSSSNDDDNKVIIKPYRGVASDGVYLANNMNEASNAFQALIGKPKYGGGINDAVLIQEYIHGNEYAVDTVAMDGDIKVIALWRYQKFPANGAPFVYQCSELIDINSNEEREVCDYVVDVLKAQGLKWGPTHTEVKYKASSSSSSSSSSGPRLIEINGRWHAQNFIPITTACLGEDAVTSTLDAYFDRDKFSSLPSRPLPKRASGLILHLVSYKEGVVTKVKYLNEIKKLKSTIYVSMDATEGEHIVKTVDIRTDMGYILLAHDDENVVKHDYDYICSLQHTMIDVEDDNTNSDDSNINQYTSNDINTMLSNSNDNTNPIISKILSLIDINILKNIITAIGTSIKKKLIVAVMIVLSSFFIGLGIMLVLPMIYNAE